MAIKSKQIEPLRMETVSWRRMLAAVPHRNQSLKVLEAGAEHMQFEIPGRRPKWLVPPITWVVKPKLTRTILLDRFGVNLWQWCDGDHTVEEIVDKFAQEFHCTFHEARVAVTGFMRSLVQRGILAIAQNNP